MYDAVVLSISVVVGNSESFDQFDDVGVIADFENPNLLKNLAPIITEERLHRKFLRGFLMLYSGDCSKAPFGYGLECLLLVRHVLGLVVGVYISRLEHFRKLK